MCGFGFGGWICGHTERGESFVGSSVNMLRELEGGSKAGSLGEGTCCQDGEAGGMDFHEFCALIGEKRTCLGQNQSPMSNESNTLVSVDAIQSMVDGPIQGLCCEQ